ITALPYEDNVLFNPGNGFGSFFLPALLIIIIHQTLFFGVGMLAGTAREENRNKKLYPNHNARGGIFRIVFGKAAAYIFLYSFLATYVTILIPHLFNLPNLGTPWNIYKILFPFLLATTFFSMSFAVVIKNRETGMVMFLFFSIILLFLSGFSWPIANMPPFWKYFSYLFPATFGVQSYIKVNTMGAEIGQIRFEYLAMWIQAGVYFLTACFSMQYVIRKENKIEKN
ncbi:MAG: ABC transporter permease, partial [Bacteroidales bacterium]